MNEQKLTYEQWCEKYMAPVDAAALSALEEYHLIDAAYEVEQARRKEYEFYINGFKE